MNLEKAVEPRSTQRTQRSARDWKTHRPLRSLHQAGEHQSRPKRHSSADSASSAVSELRLLGSSKRGMFGAPTGEGGNCMAEIWLSFKEVLGPWAIPAAGALAVLFIVMVRGILVEPGRAFRLLVLPALVSR